METEANCDGYCDGRGISRESKVKFLGASRSSKHSLALIARVSIQRLPTMIRVAPVRESVMTVIDDGGADDHQNQGPEHMEKFLQWSINENRGQSPQNRTKKLTTVENSLFVVQEVE